ncbi:hypothetical protein RHD99_08405 [Buttiauxella selenatireducens]|uniref:Uncharacterized protein n=1 Tax=Buttiauxella selenatireducens TaxID=3073902 RepID=A0ABY9SF38_9ENTR|nr:hypothetical protein [Buttiauxella sp. R73]WMY75943.1 hypothetical protein RHD99_08405 [Buttiauxella sp. R73]
MANQEHTQTRPKNRVFLRSGAISSSCHHATYPGDPEIITAPVPLVSSDSPESSLRLLDCNCSLLEFITVLSQRINDPLEQYLPDLIDITAEVVRELDESVVSVLDMVQAMEDNPVCECPAPGTEAWDEMLARAEPEERHIQQDRPEDTRRLARLNVALLTCVHSSIHSQDEDLQRFTDDMLTLALGLSCAFNRSAEDTLPEGDCLHDYCRMCRGRKNTHRQ